ncbi:hypothetical protein M427DRAFT_45141 [Gonapodya prolifera JEL478]|uniref:Uncharacterized protein n=1 Tax=Gonapodya prolifera (strain JEL478) TaxID=1344416 RepID=A0A139ACK8_GONPJ|nr:hypothetical protein M427DRAFT_45141 [Gonapodya prolifera JEL478]|eukprot:KXS14314.1 hypothetical protein M427DRAFT_45141 [Gonapodya prolifera JEL478]
MRRWAIVVWCIFLVALSATSVPGKIRWLYVQSLDAERRAHRDDHWVEDVGELHGPVSDTFILWVVPRPSDLEEIRNDWNCIRNGGEGEGSSRFSIQGIGFEGIAHHSRHLDLDCSWMTREEVSPPLEELRRRSVNRYPLWWAGTNRPHWDHDNQSEHVLFVAPEDSELADEGYFQPCVQSRRVVKFVMSWMTAFIKQESLAQHLNILVGTSSVGEGIWSSLTPTVYRILVASLLPSVPQREHSDSPCSSRIDGVALNPLSSKVIGRTVLFLPSPTLTPFHVFHHSTSLETGNNLTHYKFTRADWGVCSDRISGIVLALRDVEMWLMPKQQETRNGQNITEDFVLRLISDLDACVEKGWYEKRLAREMATEHHYRYGALGISQMGWPMFRDCSHLLDLSSYPASMQDFNNDKQKNRRRRYEIDTSMMSLRQFSAAETLEALLFHDRNIPGFGLDHGVVHLHTPAADKLLCNFYIGIFESEEVVRLPRVLESESFKSANITYGASTSAEALWTEDGYEVGVLVKDSSAGVEVMWTRTDIGPHQLSSDETWGQWEWRTAWALFVETFGVRE